jgi:hypothetical protein
MKIPLDRLEARLQALIEGSIARIFPISKNQEDLASHLIESMRENIHPQEDGKYWAPNLFILSVHPAQAPKLIEEQNLLEELADLIYQEGVQAGLQFPDRPAIRINPDPSLALHETHILAQFELDAHTDTFVLDCIPEPTGHSAPAGAYLIVDGTNIISLTGSVVNIGRSPKNDLVLKDRRVSRQHAQLRAIKGRYVFFDLDSTGGSYVNGEKVTQAALYPGDVISLAGLPVVYGQDQGTISGGTQRMSPTPDVGG